MKDWIWEVGVKTFGPSAIRGAILGLSTWLLAKQGMLDTFGIVSDSAARTTTIYWDKLSAALIVALPAVIAGVIKVTQKHAQEVIKPTEGETK